MSNFSKTIKQSEAIRELSKFKYTCLYGGSRSGKTFIIIYALIVRASKCKSRHAIVRRTFNACKRSIFMDTLPKVLAICFPHLTVKWDKTNYRIILPNESDIWIFGLDNNNSDRILGMEFSTIYFNEASELDYTPIQTVISRLAEKNDLKKRVWFDMNPSSKTHFTYWLFMEKLNPVDDEPLVNAHEYGHLLMNPKDNLENIDDEYLKILEAMPEKERQRFLEGAFSDESDGRVYYAFDRDRNISSEVVKTHGQVFGGIDFNVNPMTCVLFQVINNEVMVFDEVFLENSDTYKMCSELRKRGYKGIKLFPDSTGKNRKTSGKSDFAIIRENGFSIQYVSNPFVTDRVNNVNRLLNDDRIKINPKCKKLINDLVKVSWKDNKLDQKTNPMLTHISDCLGYGCWNLFPITSYKGSRSTTQRNF